MFSRLKKLGLMAVMMIEKMTIARKTKVSCRE